jgi:septal ring factor EnvC (AmiA/AmiB activator)
MGKVITILLFLFTSVLGWSQENQQEKLEQRKAEILREIREKEAQLQHVKSKEVSVKKQLEIQSEKIKLKEKLINTTEKQTKLLSNDMYLNQLTINRLKRELTVLKDDYAQMIVKSYKSRSEQSRAMFLLSSENFLQAYKRAQYMKQYASYRKNQGLEIQSKSEDLLVHNETLEVQKTAKQKLIEENEKERLVLEKEKQLQQELAKAIKKDKKQLLGDIKKKQQETKNIDNQIAKLLRAAIAAANKKTATAVVKSNPKTSAESTKATETSAKIVLTAEGKIESNNFRANKGKLPWP